MKGLHNVGRSSIVCLSNPLRNHRAGAVGFRGTHVILNLTFFFRQTNRGLIDPSLHHHQLDSLGPRYTAQMVSFRFFDLI